MGCHPSGSFLAFRMTGFKSLVYDMVSPVNDLARE
jgi:hypothetical protein